MSPFRRTLNDVNGGLQAMTAKLKR